jgi:hypothetical protein
MAVESVSWSTGSEEMILLKIMLTPLGNRWRFCGVGTIFYIFLLIPIGY